jgi:hypothetical protein
MGYAEAPGVAPVQGLVRAGATAEYQRRSSRVGLGHMHATIVAW